MATITGQLTSAQIKALHASPIEVIPAPGAGKIIVPTSFLMSLVYGGSNAFVAPTHQEAVAFYFNNNPAAGLGGFTASYVALATNYLTYNAAPNLSGVASNYENKAVTLYNPSTSEFTGNAANDNVINYTISYEIFDL